MRRFFYSAPSISTAIKRYEATGHMDKLNDEEIHTLERWADENNPATPNMDLVSHRHLLKRAAYQLRNGVSTEDAIKRYEEACKK